MQVREIKFRSWAKYYNEDYKMRYYSSMSTLHQKNVLVFENPPHEWVDESDYDDDIILMQYIGLKDVEGKEIYEGDLFPANTGNLYRVAWNDQAAKFSVVIERTNGKMIGIPKISMQELTKLKIVGNIYENPELIQTINK